MKHQYGKLLEFKRSKLKFLKMYVLCYNVIRRFPGPSPAISAQFTFKMCVAAGNCKKIHW